MKEIAETINRLIEMIDQNSIPIWVTYVGIFVPISISVAVAIISLIQNKKNNKLQKEIEESNERFQIALNKHEEYIQMRDNILKIYDDYCMAQNLLESVHNRIHVIFSNFSAFNGYYTLPYQLVDDVNNAIKTIYQASNRAKLLLPREDKDLRNILEVILEKYSAFGKKVNSYYHNGIGRSASENAWNIIVSSSNIIRYDYSALTDNPSLYESYLKLCDTNETKEIERLIDDLLPFFKYGPHILGKLSNENAEGQPAVSRALTSMYSATRRNSSANLNLTLMLPFS